MISTGVNLEHNESKRVTILKKNEMNLLNSFACKTKMYFDIPVWEDAIPEPFVRVLPTLFCSYV